MINRQVVNRRTVSGHNQIITIKKYLRSTAFAVLLVLGLTACVTETNSNLAKKKDQQHFLENSVAAALEYLKVGDTKNAFRHLNNGLEADPKSAEVHNAMGLLYRSMRDVENEEKHFKLAIRYDSKLSKARNNYAVFLFQQARYKEALAQLEKAVLEPSYDGRALAFENMGRCYLALNDLEKAEQSFNDALRVDREQPRPYLELAQMYFARGDLKSANQYLQQFASLGRQTARSLWLGIRIERVLGDQNALASYELALRNRFANSKEFQEYKASLSLKERPLKEGSLKEESSKEGVSENLPSVKLSSGNSSTVPAAVEPVPLVEDDAPQMDISAPRPAAK